MTPLQEPQRTWTHEQEELLNGDTGLRNVAVSAAAGSGKTSVLVERVRRFSPDHRILCVSFTERSTADLQERLHDQKNVDISTIHGLCSRVVREFGSEIGLLPFWRIQTEEESRRIFEEVFEKIFSIYPLHDLNHGSAAFLDFARWACTTSARVATSSTSERVFLERVAEEFSRVKRQRRVLGYEDLERVALDLLRIPSVAKKMQTRYHAVFVDEFQDTSRTQGEIVGHLIRPETSTFVVGDRKQSIYRFRGADVSVFEQMCQKLPFRRVLSRNFRSTPDVINRVNAICSPILDDYEPMVATRASIETGLCTRVAFFAKDRRHAKGAEARAMAWQIAKLRSQGIPLCDIVILLRRIRGNAKLLQELEKNGLRVSLASAASALQDENIRILINLWIYQCEPWQNLRGFQMLANFFSEKFGGALGTSVESALSGIPRVNGEYRNDFHHKTCGQFYQELNKLFLLDERFGISAGLFRSAVLFAQAQGMSPTTLARRWHQDLTQGIEPTGFASIAPPANLAGSIRVLTVHASKGLEFPFVLLGDLGSQVRRLPPYVNVGGRLRMLDRDEEGELDRSDAEVQAMLALENEAEQKESARLLYVALTRAKEAFFAFENAEAKVSENSWTAWIQRGMPEGPVQSVPDIGAMVEFELAAVAGPAASIVSDVSEAPAAAGSAGAAVFPSLGPLHIEVPQYRRARIGVLEWLSLQKEPDSREVLRAQMPPAQKQNSHAAQIGKQVHLFLEQEDFSGLRLWAEKAGIDLSHFQHWLDTPDGVLLFPRAKSTQRAPRVFKEFAFEMPAPTGEILTGRIDRLIVYNDSIWVVDFKVLTARQNVAEIKSRYSPQLTVYVNAVRHWLGATLPGAKIHGVVLDILAHSGGVLHELTQSASH